MRVIHLGMETPVNDKFEVLQEQKWILRKSYLPTRPMKATDDRVVAKVKYLLIFESLLKHNSCRPSLQLLTILWEPCFWHIVSKMALLLGQWFSAGIRTSFRRTTSTAESGHGQLQNCRTRISSSRSECVWLFVFAISAKAPDIRQIVCLRFGDTLAEESSHFYQWNILCKLFSFTLYSWASYIMATGLKC